MVCNDPKWSEIIGNCLKTIWNVFNGPGHFKMIWNGPKWYQIVPNVPNLFKLSQNVPHSKKWVFCYILYPCFIVFCFYISYYHCLLPGLTENANHLCKATSPSCFLLYQPSGLQTFHQCPSHHWSLLILASSSLLFLALFFSWFLTLLFLKFWRKTSSRTSVTEEHPVL